MAIVSLPSFQPALSGVGGYTKGLLAGGMAGIVAGAAIGVVLAVATGGASVGAMALTGALWGGGLMAAVGSVAGTVTGVVNHTQAQSLLPSEQLVNIARTAHQQGMELGHSVAASQNQKKSFGDKYLKEKTVKRQPQQPPQQGM